MSGLFSKIDQFNPDQEEWPQYVERLEQFFEANEITGKAMAIKRRAIFLSVIGPNPYPLLRSLLAPTKPSTKTFEELVAKLTEHYSPEPPEVMQRFRFNSRSRKPGESIAAYVAELRRIAQHCNFGSTLDKMLCDRLVYGVNDDSIRRKLLQEKDVDLTFKRALVIALGAETADQNLREMKAPLKEVSAGVSVKSEPVHRVSGKKATPSTSAGGGEVTCHRCGSPGHLAPACHFKDCICHKCKKKGHLARVCRSSSKSQQSFRGPRSGRKQPHTVRQIDQEPEISTDSDEQPIMTVRQGQEHTPPIKVHVVIDECTVPIEVDTGASVSIMGEATYYKLWPRRGLGKTNLRLQTYSKEPIQVVGSTEVKASYQGQTTQLPLVVVKGEGPTLLGRNWLSKIQLNWREIYSLSSPGLHELLSKFDDVFKEGLGTFQGYEAKIEVTPDATPRFCKARTVPYSMRPKLEELDSLVAEGTLEPIEYSEWAAPIVEVLKTDRKSVRVCGDFRMTVNPVSRLNRYPIPKVEDLFSTLAGGKTFTKLDLSQAYQQLKLDVESRKYVVINTHKGLFRYTRLPYGISSAPGRKPWRQGITSVTVYIDDILITGKTESDHLQSLATVLERLSKAGLRAKKSKCQFMAPSVAYLGHVIDAQGLHPLPDKIQAIQRAPTPKNVTELKSYLGLLTYYGKFLPSLSTGLAPLYSLLGKDVAWKWSPPQETAFQESKDLLVSSFLLVHFDPTLPLLLACDASAYGIGAVLAHRMPDGSEKPVGYASRTLNSAELNYSQLEKEGLACIFGIKRFYSYVFGYSRHGS